MASRSQEDLVEKVVAAIQIQLKLTLLLIQLLKNLKQLEIQDRYRREIQQFNNDTTTKTTNRYNNGRAQQIDSTINKTD